MTTTIATKADLQLLRQETRAELQLLRQEMKSLLELLSRDMTIRLGSMLFLGLGLLFAALKLTA